LAVIADNSFQPPVIGAPEDGIDLGGFVRLLWRAKWFIALVTACTCAISGYMILHTQGIFTARMVVQSAGQQGATGVAGALGGLTGLVGLQAAAEDREFSQFQALLKSALMAERLQRKYGIMHDLFADSWDAANKRWVEPKGWRQDILGALRELRGQPRWLPPSIYDLADLINTAIAIKKVGSSSSVYEIAYKSPTREFGIRFLEVLHKETEAAMREERKARVTEQARYLRSRIETTAIMEYRLALVSLLSEQDKTMMLLESNLPFATTVIDPPYAPTRIETPSLSVFVFAGTFGGVVLGIMMVLIYAIGRQALHGSI